MPDEPPLPCPPDLPTLERAAWDAWYRDAAAMAAAAAALQAAARAADDGEAVALGQAMALRAEVLAQHDDAAQAGLDTLQAQAVAAGRRRIAWLLDDLRAGLRLRAGAPAEAWALASARAELPGEARPATDHWLNAAVLQVAAMQLGRYDDALAQGYRALDAAHATGLASLAAATAHNLATDQLNLLNLDDALPLQAHALQALQQAGLRHALPYVWENLILMHDIRGLGDRAVDTLDAWRAAFGGTLPPADRRRAGVAIALGLLAAGRPDDALAAVEQPPEVADGDRHRTSAWHWARGRALLALGRPAEALAACEAQLAALEAAGTPGTPYNLVRLHGVVQEASEALGDYRRALEAHKALQRASLPLLGHSARARYVSLKLQQQRQAGEPAEPLRDRRRLDAIDEGLTALARRLDAAHAPVPAPVAAGADGPPAEALARQRRFVAQVSHEIRNALTGVLGINTLLEHTQLDARQSRYVEMARSSAESVLALVNDILDIARLEAGQFQLASEPFAPLALLQATLAPFEAQAQQQGLALVLVAPPRLPTLRGDALRVRQIVTNLVGNALKFTERGGVELRVQAEPAGADGRVRLQVDVVDTGPGIAPEALATLFQDFAQAGPQAQRQRGSGLGLALSRELARRMGGDLDATSVPGQGSCFRFSCRLPAEPV